MAIDLLSIPLILLYAVIGFVAYWYLNARPKNVPPGPMGLPYVGYAPFLTSAPFMDFDKLGKKYKSNIISLYLGSVFTVVLNDLDAVRAAFVDQDENFVGRPKRQFVTNYSATGQDGEIHSILALEGPKWKSHHDFLHDGFEELGVRTPRMEVSIQEEIGHLITAVMEEKGAPFDFFRLNNPTTSSIVARQAFGYRWGTHSEEYKSFIEGSDEAFELRAGSPIQVMPWTRFIPGPLKQKWEATKRLMERQQAFLHDVVKRHEETYENGRIRDLVDMYIRHMKGDGPLDPITFQNEDDCTSTVISAFQAGGESTNSALEWALLFLLHNPDIQRKIHEELDAQIEEGRPVLFSDKNSLPYTTGAVYEAFRLGGNSAIGMPHSNLEETQLLGYRIPKRSMIIMNIWSCHRNPKDWKYPEEYNPENWINDQGQFEVPEGFLSFSAGSRMCPGLEMAKMMVFLIFANLLHKFEFINPKGQKLPDVHDYAPGISARALRFKLEAVPRF